MSGPRGFFRKELFVLDPCRRKGCDADRELFTGDERESRKRERDMESDGIRGSNRSKGNVGRLAFQVSRTGTNCVSSVGARRASTRLLSPSSSATALDAASVHRALVV